MAAPSIRSELIERMSHSLATPPKTNPRSGLETALLLLSRGRPAEARPLAERAVAARPRDAEAHRVLGLCLRAAGEAGAAEAALRTSLRLDRGDAEGGGGAGRAAERGRAPSRGGAGCYARRWRTNRRSGLLMSQLSRQLTATGRPEEALRVTAKLVAETAPEHEVLAAHGAALKAAGQPERALAIHVRARRRSIPKVRWRSITWPPTRAISASLAPPKRAPHALSPRAARHRRRSWSMRGALLGANRLDEAERAFSRGDPARSCLSGRPPRPGAVDLDADGGCERGHRNDG